MVLYGHTVSKWAVFHNMASVLLCLVIAITDGDTLKVRCDAQLTQPAQTLTVRLAEIDAPEKRQAFGTKSRAHLAALCFQRAAQVHPVAKGRGRDRYGRTVARVACAGVDANATMVRDGFAWVFDRYVTDQALYQSQDKARAAKRGLWSDAAPMAPWEWRRTQRGKQGIGR
jgi:endonuclease YncB( thermonuclease family)